MKKYFCIKYRLEFLKPFLFKWDLLFLRYSACLRCVDNFVNLKLIALYKVVFDSLYFHMLLVSAFIFIHIVFAPEKFFTWTLLSAISTIMFNYTDFYLTWNQVTFLLDSVLPSLQLCRIINLDIRWSNYIQYQTVTDF